MKIDELFSMIEDDLTINQENIEDKIYKVPQLHAKYLRIFFREKTRLHGLEKSLNEVYKDLYHYYTTNYDKVLENQKEIQFHILADPKYADLYKNVEAQKVLVDCIDRTLKKVQQLTFDVKSIIDYRKYLQGV